MPTQETRSIPANQTENNLRSGASPRYLFRGGPPISHQMPSKARHPGSSGSLSGGSRREEPTAPAPIIGTPTEAPENVLFYEKTLLDGEPPDAHDPSSLLDSFSRLFESRTSLHGRTPTQAPVTRTIRDCAHAGKHGHRMTLTSGAIFRSTMLVQTSSSASIRS